MKWKKIVQIQEKLKELMLVMYRLNLPPKRAIRLVGSENIIMIEVSLISTWNIIIFLIVEYLLGIKELRVALLEQFDGTRWKFWRSINQIQLTIKLQFQSYPTWRSYIKFIGTLLLHFTLLCIFYVLLTDIDLILNNLEDFLLEF